MTIAEVLLVDFDVEVANTRRVLERVPSDKCDWKPHEKSFALGPMAFHVATLPKFGLTILETELFDLTAAVGTFPRYAGETHEQLLELYNTSATSVREKLSASSDEDLLKNWKMIYGSHTLADTTRYYAYRGMFFNHLIHHRGQINVYLRLLDVKVPGIYGPSADEPFGS